MVYGSSSSSSSSSSAVSLWRMARLACEVEGIEARKHLILDDLALLPPISCMDCQMGALVM